MFDYLGDMSKDRRATMSKEAEVKGIVLIGVNLSMSTDKPMEPDR
jgi:hypothetical protein